MANNIKGLTIEIGGDTSELSKALADVDKKSRSLSSELGELNRMLKLDPGNTELLAQKQKVLAEAIKNTSKRLDTLKEAEKQVQAQFERGEVSEEQVRALQREVIATERKLNSYENAAKETADQIDKVGQESEDAKKDVDKLGDEAKETGDQLDKAGDKATTFGDKAKRAGAIAAKGLAAVAAAAGAAVTALVNATVEAAAYADDILTMSTVTGMATDDLQAFNYAAGLLDVEVETISKSLAKNTKSMASAADGSAAYADAYSKLGVSVTDANGNLRDGETVYWEAIDALGQMSNETERDAIAMQLFGKSAQELNPLIEAGSEKVAELKQEAKDVGAVMSEETLAALGAFDDSIQRLKGSAGAAKNALGGVLLPELQMLTDSGTDLLGEFTRKLNTSGGGLDGFVATVDSMSGEIAGMLASMATQLLDGIATVLPSLVTVAMSLVTQLTTSVISMLPQLVTTGIQVIMALLQGLTTAFPQVITAIVNMIPQLVNALVTGIPQLIQGAVQLLLAIVQAIPQIIPPLVAAIPTIVLSVIDALVTAIPQLIEGAVQFLMAIIDAIPQVINALIPQVPTIVTAVIEGLISCMPALLQGAIQLLNAIIDAIPVIIQALIPQIPTIVNTVVTQLAAMAPTLLAAAVKLFWEIIKAIPKIVAALFQNLPQILKAITSVLSAAPRLVWNILKNVISRVVAWAGDMATKGRDAAKRLLDSVVNGIKSLPQRVKTVGKNLVMGLWHGIKDKLAWLKNKIKSFAKSALGAIKEFFGVKSPSRETMWIGEMLDEGLAKGVTDAAGQPIKAMQRVSSGILDAANGGIGFERQLTTPRVAAAPYATGASGLDTLAAKLDGIYERLGRLQIVLDTGTLVGETLDKIDAGLATNQLLRARGV